MAEDADGAPSPLRRRRRSAAVAAVPPPETDDVVDPVAGAAPGRLRIDQRYLWMLVAGSLLAGLVAALAAGFATDRTAPTYQSQALLNLDQPRAVALATDDGVVAKLSRLRYKYAGLVRTETFAKPVASQLHLPVLTVLRTLTTSVDQDSLVMAVGARDGNRDRARQIAAAAAQHLVQFTKSQQQADRIPAVNQVTFTIVTPALPAVKIAPSNGKVFLVALGAFVFVAGGALAFGYLWLRDR